MLKKLSGSDAALRAAILEKLMGQLDGHEHEMRKGKLHSMMHPAASMSAMMAEKGDPTAGAKDPHQEEMNMPSKKMADGGAVDEDAPEGDEDSNAMEGLKGESPASFGSGDSSAEDATEAAGDPKDEAQGAEPSADEVKKKLRMML